MTITKKIFLIRHAIRKKIIKLGPMFSVSLTPRIVPIIRRQEFNFDSKPKKNPIMYVTCVGWLLLNLRDREMSLSKNSSEYDSDYSS